MKMASKLSLSVQYADDSEPPPRHRVRALVRAALPAGGSLTVRFVGGDEMAALNRETRGKDGSTDVLSFAYRQHDGGAVVGDIVICPSAAAAAATAQQKNMMAHLSHLIVHGALHLAGYRHHTAAAAAVMERAECNILRRFGIDDPYLAP